MEKSPTLQKFFLDQKDIWITVGISYTYSSDSSQGIDALRILMRVGLLDIDEFRFCGEEEDTPIHLVTVSPAIVSQRRQSLGSEYRKVEELKPLQIVILKKKKIWNWRVSCEKALRGSSIDLKVILDCYLFILINQSWPITDVLSLFSIFTKSQPPISLLLTCLSLVPFFPDVRISTAIKHRLAR